jgi:hypothetical protein
MPRLVVFDLVVPRRDRYNTERKMKDLILLTRRGCRNTAEMQANLDAALEVLGWPVEYHRVDIDTLPRSDPRTGYPTPSLLHEGHDVFGLPVPTPPFHVPS